MKSKIKKTKLKICIVVANYYPKISEELFIGASHVLKTNDIKNFRKIEVPGIFEIPMVIAKNILLYDAFIALGCVIKGKTPHFNFISEATTKGILDLAIIHKKPIGNGVITCLNIKQAVERSNSKKKNKGGEAAKAVVSVLNIRK